MKGIKSDHSTFVLVLKHQNQNRGKGYWKLNTMLLKDGDFVDKMNSKLDNWICELSAVDPIEKWEKIKSKIADFVKKEGKQRGSECKLIISELIEKATQLEDNFPNLCEKDVQLLNDTKADLDEELQIRARGLIFRSKATWLNEAEQNTKYFFNLEKTRAEAKTCHCLIDEKGQEVRDGDKILMLQEKFYSDLYSFNPDVKFEHLSNPFRQVR